MVYYDSEPTDNGLPVGDVNERLDYEGVGDPIRRSIVGAEIAAVLDSSAEDEVDFAAWEASQY